MQDGTVEKNMVYVADGWSMISKVHRGESLRDTLKECGRRRKGVTKAETGSRKNARVCYDNTAKPLNTGHFRSLGFRLLFGDASAGKSEK